MSFRDLAVRDMDNVFLSDFATDAIYKSKTQIKSIKVQFLKNSLDKLETLYEYCICKYSDIEYVSVGDTILISDVEYGIVDYEVDSFRVAVTLFLQKV